MPFRALLRRVVDVRPDEVRAVALSFLYFLAVLTSYYLLRPLREERAVASGVGSLHWLFTATFVTMLAVVPAWSALLARVRRTRLLPFAYRFFLVNLMVFWALFQVDGARIAAARVFFVWLTVFNVLAVSVFWSVMADLFDDEQGKRLFGFISVGGSAGALAGPALAATLATRIAPAYLLIASAALLEVAARCVSALARVPRRDAAPDEPIGGGALAGMAAAFTSPYLGAIAGYVAFSTVLASVGYVLQTQVVAEARLTQGATIALFARLDLAVNALAGLLQVLVTGRLLTRFGVGPALAALPPLAAAGFAWMAAAPSLGVVSALHVARRGVGFGLGNPALNVLFTVVSREEKYKTKAFIDTLVFRGGDVVGSWLSAGLRAAGAGFVGQGAVAAGLGVLWLPLAIVLARRHRAIAQHAAAGSRG